MDKWTEYIHWLCNQNFLLTARHCHSPWGAMSGEKVAAHWVMATSIYWLRVSMAQYNSTFGLWRIPEIIGTLLLAKNKYRCFTFK